jgi:hypothetical protein
VDWNFFNILFQHFKRQISNFLHHLGTDNFQISIKSP